MSGYRFAIFDTAIGPCGIAWGDRGIHAVQLPMGSKEKTRNRIRQRYGEIPEGDLSGEVRAAIDGMVELLAGKPNDLRDVCSTSRRFRSSTAVSTTSRARSRRARR
jgi:methylated-DNA-[protein]-cysteine S-methyltransferase